MGRTPDTPVPVKEPPSERMRPPRQGRSQSTVQAIEQAIDDIVEQVGLGGLTSKAVAARAGVGPGTLYQYFRSREALIASWELRMMQRRFGELYQIIADAMSTYGQLDRVIWSVAHKSVMIALEHVWAPRDDAVGFVSDLRERQTFVDRAIDFLVNALENAPSRHRIIPKDLPLAVRTACYAVIYTAYPIALRRPTPEERDAFAAQVADMITRFLVGAAPAPPAG